MRYIVAKNVQHAVCSAVTDFGWEQMGPLRFKDAEDETVLILTDPYQLQGRRGTIVYMGYGCALRKDWDQLRALADVGVALLKEAPLLPKVKEIFMQQGRGYYT